MSWTVYSNRVPALFPQLVPVEQKPGKRWREWGKRDPQQIKCSLKYEPSTPKHESKLYQPVPQRDDGPVMINSHTVRVMEDARRRAEQERNSNQ